jgi:hypothetical protein
MNTIIEHLNELPEPYRTEALNETEKQGRDLSEYQDFCKDKEFAVMLAFDWSKSMKGEDYWSELCETL